MEGHAQNVEGISVLKSLTNGIGTPPTVIGAYTVLWVMVTVDPNADDDGEALIEFVMDAANAVAGSMAATTAPVNSAANTFLFTCPHPFLVVCLICGRADPCTL